MPDLAQATDARAQQTDSGLRMGAVASIATTGGVMCTINGANVGPFACVSSYQPKIGDEVAIFRQDSTWLVLGISAKPTASGTLTSMPLTAGWSSAGLNSLSLVSKGGRSFASWQATMFAGTKTDGTTLANIPAGYIPVSGIDITVNVNITAAAGGQSPHFHMTPSAMQCNGCASATVVTVNADWPLDV